MKYSIDKEKRPAYLQLYKQIRDDIVSENYPYKSKLPSKRSLADETGVSIITVEHAYALLCDEGYVEAKARSGFVVIFRPSEGFASVSEHHTKHLHTHHTESKYPEFPLSVLSKTMRKVLTDHGELLLEKSPNPGCIELREAIRLYLARNRGIEVDVEQIIIGAGSEYLYTVQGVPGFYQKDGKWTLNFCSYTAGILLPAKDYEGRISGFQIRLDTPLKNPDETSDKPGAKYIWLSSSGKQNGCSSGSPVHLIGERNAKTIYVTEGVLKADIAHCLTGRTFAAIAGANNLTSLEDLFKVISRTGTQLIVEAHDMDKYKNEMVDKGASAIRQLANKYGMDCRRLTWNPNYKGIDDWQLALRRKSQKKEREQMTFRDRFMHGLCDFEELDDEITTWHESSEHAKTLPEYLGLSDEEYAMCADSDYVLQKHLLTRRTHQYFRIYQLDFDDDHQTKKFAFDGIDALRKAGYEQPPAAEYRLVCDDYIPCDMTESDAKRLDFLFLRYNDTLPENYHGRSISPSDVVELYDEEKRRYYYRDRDSFCPVKFSPFLAKPMKQG